MAILFNPFGSSDTSPDLSSAYSTTATAPANANKVAVTSKVNAPSSPRTSDPEPFVWETKKETVASKAILKDLNSQSTTPSVAKAKKSSIGLGKTSGLGKATKKIAKSTPKQHTVSKTNSDYGDAPSFAPTNTADADLNSFFGKSKSKPKQAVKRAKPATKVAKAPATTQPAVSKIKSKPIKVASKPFGDAVKASSPWATQEVKTTSDNHEKDEMFSFSPRGSNDHGDAPMLAPVKSKDFDMPEIKPTNGNSVASKTKSSSQDISGSFQTVLTKPVKSPVVRELNIKNPLQTRLTVSFLANGKKVSLKPGQHFQIRQSEDVKVKFSRGGSFGFSERSLSEGNYEFSVSRKEGWKLAQ